MYSHYIYACRYIFCIAELRIVPDKFNELFPPVSMIHHSNACFVLPGISAVAEEPPEELSELAAAGLHFRDIVL